LRQDANMVNALTYLGRINWRDDKRAFGMRTAGPDQPTMRKPLLRRTGRSPPAG
jgi:hypothetical protein